MTKIASKCKDLGEARPTDVLAVYLAAQDPRTPWYARWLAVAVAAYALSPIDLIPDFIPVVGYLDDLLIVPLGILIVIRLIPPEVMAEHRAIADDRQAFHPVSLWGAAIVVVIWIIGAGALFMWLQPSVSSWMRSL